MHDHEDKLPRGVVDKVILVGNANVGKSVIFGLLTGKYATVSNYPGTTVEVMHGNISLDGQMLYLMDTPGTNSLIPMSEDEKVTRDILIGAPFRSVIQVADAKNLKRTLMLALQLSEAEVPMMLVLNMWDEATERGIQTDLGALEKILGARVISAIAPQKKGINQIREALRNPTRPGLKISYDVRIEKAVEQLTEVLPDGPVSKRALALMLFSGALGMKEWLTAHLSEDAVRKTEEIIDDLQKHFERSLSEVIARSRLANVERIFNTVVTRTEPSKNRALQLFGQWATHPLWGLPILCGVLYLIWLFVGNFGAGTLVDFLENVVFEKYLNPWAIQVVSYIPIQFFRDLLVGPYGVVTMAITYAIGIILPITVTFFLAFGFLEDSGYLPRLAVMSNRIFNMMGLNGKAVLPMVLGLGCVTMATMTTRILETRRERLITTFLLALAVPCSAQLGVIMGLLGSLSYRVTALWIASVVATLLLSGWLAAKVLPGDRPALFLELPPIRMPRFRNILVKTAGRVEWYLREAVPLFVIGTLILFFLDRLHVLEILRRVFSPVVVSFLGLPREATDAFIMGFLRRDYGAAGFFQMFRAGQMTPVQVLVSLVTVTLFVPCMANLLMMVKERGVRTALIMLGLIMPFAVLAGGTLNFLVNLMGLAL